MAYLGAWCKNRKCLGLPTFSQLILPPKTHLLLLQVNAVIQDILLFPSTFSNQYQEFAYFPFCFLSYPPFLTSPLLLPSPLLPSSPLPPLSSLSPLPPLSSSSFPLLLPSPHFLFLPSPPPLPQELMNRHGEKERLTSVPILCQITLQNVP